MPGKRFSAEQIVAKLREAERLQGQGQTIPQVCKKLGVSEQTFYRWRTKYGALKEDEAQRLKAFEARERAAETDRCRAGVWTSRCSRICPRETCEPGETTCGGRASAVARHGVSERRACQVVGQHRSTQRYAARSKRFRGPACEGDEPACRATIRDGGIARSGDCSSTDGWQVNRKRVERLWRREGIARPADQVEDVGQTCRWQRGELDMELPGRVRRSRVDDRLRDRLHGARHAVPELQRAR